MKDIFHAVAVTDRVYWVGAVDWTTRNFHGYFTSRGTTYNAFLVMSEKVTLIDTVKAPFRDEMFARIASIVDPGKIDYVVSNHSEPDHTGCLKDVIDAARPEKVFASKNGAAALERLFGLGDQVSVVADGGSVSLGDANLTFIETRMCHWPDSMVSYLHEDELLFSQDAFGMHLATYQLFDDECDEATLDFEAAKYYANILLPLSSFVIKTLDKAGSLGVNFRIIAPDHGPIWRRDPQKIIDAYARWSAQVRTDKAIVVYDTMWKSTELMARSVGEGLTAGGAKAKLMPLEGSHRSDVAMEILDAGALIVGSPTLNKQLFPTLADCLCYLKGLQPKGLLGAAFGSHGWSGEATALIEASLGEMGVEIVSAPAKSRHAPDTEELQQCYALGQAVAAKLKNR